uniref:Uncharacterized protein n=1 Tax=Glossina austeni TaxID=7395 RepID=A0A1A9V6X7_GLOAU
MHCLISYRLKTERTYALPLQQQGGEERKFAAVPSTRNNSSSITNHFSSPNSITSGFSAPVYSRASHHKKLFVAKQYHKRSFSTSLQPFLVLEESIRLSGSTNWCGYGKATRLWNGMECNEPTALALKTEELFFKPIHMVAAVVVVVVGIGSSGYNNLGYKLHVFVRVVNRQHFVAFQEKEN